MNNTFEYDALPKDESKQLFDRIFNTELKDNKVFSSVLAGTRGRYIKVGFLLLELTKYRADIKNALKKQIYDEEIHKLNDKINNDQLDYDTYIYFVNKSGTDIYKKMEALKV